MQRDILDDLGYLFLGSRLKRLAERMQADAAKVIARAGLPIQPAQFPLLAAIDRYGPMTVGDAVLALRVSQPAVTRSLTSLVGLGLLKTTRATSDQRQKTIALTAKGRGVMRKAQRVVWPSVGAAATELCKGVHGDLLEQIAAVEARLDRRSLETRVVQRASVQIVEFSDALAREFHAINAEWISSMFVLEPADLEVLVNPRARIVDRGGAILFAATEEHGVVGTCALYRTAPGEFELTKMGVRETARGLKVGERLLDAAIERARLLGATKLYLLTNSACKPAIHLYEKAGFVHDTGVREAYGPRYARCDVAMLYPSAALAQSGAQSGPKAH